MTTAQSENRNKSRRWVWAALSVLVLGIGLAAWILNSQPPAKKLKPLEAASLDPAVHTEADPIIDAPPAENADTHPAATNSEPEIPDDSALETSRSPTPIMDLAARERFEFGGRNPGPGAADVAARTAELQPPEAELLKMTSSELVDELSASPLQVSIYHSSDSRFDGQLAAFERTHKGVGILLSRPDGASALLETYQAYSDSLMVPEPPGDARGTGLEFASLEMLLGATPLLEQFESANQLPALIETVLQSVERQADYDAAQPEPVYGEAMIANSATVVGRSLERLNDPAFIEWITAPERLGILTDRPPTHEEAREILDMAATAYGPETLEVTPGSACE